MSESRKLLETAVKLGLLTRDKMGECEEIQQMMEKMGIHEEVEDLLLKKQYLTKEQIKQIRESMGKAAEILPGYEDQGKLGHGRLGTVSKARQTAMDRTVAVKIIPLRHLSCPEEGDRLLKEARTAARILHPSLIKPLDCGKVGADIFVVSEFADGATLRDLVLSKGPLSERRALEMTGQIAEALAEIHRHKLVHRAVTPGNVFIGEDGKARLADFGLTPSVSVDTKYNDKGVAYGAAGWMAPEQIVGLDDLDGRADLYGLGATLYYALTGQPLFVAPGEKNRVAKQLEDVPADPRTHVPTLSGSTCTIVMRLLDRDRAQRFDSADSVMRAVQLALTPASAPPPPPAPKKRWYIPAGIAAGLLAFAVFGAFLLLDSGSRGKPDPRLPEAPRPPIAKPNPPPEPPAPPAPDATPDPKELAAEKDYLKARSAFEAQTWPEALALFEQVERDHAATRYVAERRAEIGERAQECRRKIQEASQPSGPDPSRDMHAVEGEFRRVQDLMAGRRWKDAHAAATALAAKVSSDETSAGIVKDLLAKCDREIAAETALAQVRTAAGEKRWKEIAEMVQAFQGAHGSTVTGTAAALELEEARGKATKEIAAHEAVEAYRGKLAGEATPEDLKEFETLARDHGATETFKAAEPELRKAVDAALAKLKAPAESQAKDVYEQAEKASADKKYPEAADLYTKLLDEFAHTDFVKGKQEEIAQKKELCLKRGSTDREANARKEFSKAKALIDKKNYEEGVPALKSFQEKFGETEFGKSKEREIASILEKAEAELEKVKKQTLDDFDGDLTAWEGRGVDRDRVKTEAVEKGKFGQAGGIHIPGHDERPTTGRWPRAQKHLSEDLPADTVAFTFWAKADKPCKVTFEVRMGEDDSECSFAVEKSLTPEWQQYVVSISDLKLVWRRRQRGNAPKLEPDKIREIAFGMMNPGKAIDFIVDQLRIEPRR